MFWRVHCYYGPERRSCRTQMHGMVIIYRGKSSVFQAIEQGYIISVHPGLEIVKIRIDNAVCRAII